VTVSDVPLANGRFIAFARVAIRVAEAPTEFTRTGPHYFGFSRTVFCVLRTAGGTGRTWDICEIRGGADAGSDLRIVAENPHLSAVQVGTLRNEE
jgi:hypothetical protein